MDNVIEELQLSRYQSIMERAADCPSIIGLIDAEGVLKNTEFAETNSTLLDAVGEMNDSGIQWQQKQAAEFKYHARHFGMLFFTPIRLGADEQQFWVCSLICTLERSLSPEHCRVTYSTLKDIAQIIEHDYSRDQALQGMSAELAARYEELNLLYGMDGNVKDHEQQSETEILHGIVDNCSEYMNVDLVAMIVPEDDLCMVKSRHDIPLNTLDRIVNKFKGQLYSILRSTHETLVVNRNETVDWMDPKLNIPYKLIATPILKATGQLYGILVVANHESRIDFTNSDRKLNEVIAADISKIIQSRRDSLTGLLNREGFENRLEQTVHSCSEKDVVAALLYLDIDQFKVINDVSGHNAGDKLLTQLGALLNAMVRNSDSLGRLGGDEFGIILEQCPLTKAISIAEKIRDRIKAFRFVHLDKMFNNSVSIGVVEISSETTNAEALMAHADIACYTAKEMGRNRVRIYEKSDQSMSRHKDDMLWISRINNALEENRFRIYRQRIAPINPAIDNPEHYEILLRMIDEKGDIVPPFGFIPAAERFDLMSKLDRWVVSTTLKTMEEDDKQGQKDKVSCAINLSGQSLCDEGFIDFVALAIEDSCIEPSRLCFEVTETAAIINLTQALGFIEAVKKIGCSFALDDFGSGMSSFSYLKNLPVDYLKIDGQFVKNMLNDPVDHAMVESIHQIGHTMGLKTIAEFVENEATIECLIKIGVDYVQGYILSKPEPFEIDLGKRKPGAFRQKKNSVLSEVNSMDASS